MAFRLAIFETHVAYGTKMLSSHQTAKPRQQHGRAELSADYCVSNTATRVRLRCRPPASTHTRVAGD